MEAKDLTLITTTRNRPDRIGYALKSIVNQHILPTRWIIYIDQEDLSPYNQSINEIQREYSGATIISEGHLGRSKALNYVHNMVKTRYVGWLDDDDMLHPHCVSSLQNISAEFIYTTFYSVTKEGLKYPSYNNLEYSYSAMLKRNLIHHFKAYSLDLFEKVGGIDESFDTSMDYELILRMLKHTDPVKINKALYYYFLHDTNISKVKRNRQIINSNRAREMHG